MKWAEWYYWFYHTLCGLPHPFTWYMRRSAREHPFLWVGIPTGIGLAWWFLVVHLWGLI